MSTSIHRRVSALEASSASGVDFILILTKIVRPGDLGREMQTASVYGQRFVRADDESESQFTDRIEVFAKANTPPGHHAARVFVNDNDLAL